MNDADYLLNLLRDGRELTTGEILAYSQHERGCGMTVHSRAAELRKRGHKIATRCLGRKNGRAIWSYRLETLAEPVSFVGTGNRLRERPSSPSWDVSAAGDVDPFPSPAVPLEQLTLGLPGAAFKRAEAA